MRKEKENWVSNTNCEKRNQSRDWVALAAQELGAGTKIGSLLLILRKEKEIEKLRLGGWPRAWRKYDIK